MDLVDLMESVESVESKEVVVETPTIDYVEYRNQLKK